MPLQLAECAICLTHDSRFATEERRIRDLFRDRVARLYFRLDGDGETFPRFRYHQIHDHAVPESFNGTPGAYWYTRAFQGAVRRARDLGWPEFLCLEDDCDLLPNFDDVTAEALGQIDRLGLCPDLLYFGANHSEATTTGLAPNLLQCDGSWTTHCVLIRSSVYDAIIDAPPVKPGDVILAQDVQPRCLAVAVWPSVAIQRPMRSVIWQKDVDYGECWTTKGKTHRAQA